MMAAGECAEQRKRVRVELGTAGEKERCSASIGDMCGGLGELLASLRAAEAAA